MKRRVIAFGLLIAPLIAVVAFGWRGRSAPADPLAEVREKVGTRSAGPLLEQLRRDRLRNPEVYLLSAQQARLEGKGADAAAYLDEATALGSPPSATERERALQRAGSHPQRARAALEPLLAAHPDHADLILTLAEAELQTGHHDRAEELADRVLQRVPADARALSLRGRARVQGRRLAEARADLERAVAGGPESLSFSAARVALATCLLDLGEFARALELFRAARADEPTNLLALFGVGRAASYLGHWDDAERAFLAVLDLRPGHVETLLALAQVVEQRGDLARALGYLEGAETGDPKRLETLSRLVKLLAALGQSERAGRYEQRYRELDPTGNVTGRGPQPSVTP